MGSKKPFSGNSDKPSTYAQAQQIAHRILKKYEDLSLEDRRRLFLEEMKTLELPDDVRNEILREFG
jgi:hypothetical protein